MADRIATAATRKIPWNVQWEKDLVGSLPFPLVLPSLPSLAHGSLQRKKGKWDFINKQTVKQTNKQGEKKQSDTRTDPKIQSCGWRGIWHRGQCCPYDETGNWVDYSSFFFFFLFSFFFGC
jgi:hypothetical protein